jgi:hypothetical protein
METYVLSICSATDYEDPNPAEQETAEPEKFLEEET